MKKDNGFSLIELLIVVVIIGIIAAIAVPNLMAARRSANEASAISSIRVISSAQAVYRTTYGGGQYADQLFVLGAVGLVDETLSTLSGVYIVKSGYNFVHNRIPATPTTVELYDTQVFPAVASGVTQTGTKSFYSNESGVIWGVSGGTPPGGTSSTVRTPNSGSPIE